MHNQVKPHAIITGGSSGIGKALAKQLVAEGYNISIIARDIQKLEIAKNEIINLCSCCQKVHAVSADVANQAAIQKAITECVDLLGAPDILIASAGIALPGYFETLPIENFERAMQVNYFGNVYAIKAVLPAMRAANKGHIVIISSGAALTGIFGYTSYGASKFALRGFAEALRSEMKPLDIKVSIVYPPDTDTPQLTAENRIKPLETKAITGSAKVMSADHVARVILRGIQKNKFAIAPGLEMKLLLRLHSVIAGLLYAYFDSLIKKTRKQFNTTTLQKSD